MRLRRPVLMGNRLNVLINLNALVNSLRVFNYSPREKITLLHKTALLIYFDVRNADNKKIKVRRCR